MKPSYYSRPPNENADSLASRESAAASEAHSSQFARTLGVSTAFTTRTSATSFLPQIMRSKTSNPTALEFINADTGEKLKVKQARLHLSAEGWGLKSEEKTKKPRRWMMGLVGVIVLALAGGVAVVLLMQGFDSENVDFCEEGDDIVRSFIASEFDDSFDEDGVLDYEGKIIECIPDDAFAALSPTQRIQLRSVTTIKIIGNGLQKISNKALIGDELERVRVIAIEDNNIADLGDDFLASLPNLEEVILSTNAFLSLSSDVFRNSSANLLTMDFNPLREIPTALIASSMTDVSLIRCDDLVSFEPDMFSDTPIINLQITNSPLSTLFENPEELALALGLGEGTLVIV